MNKKAGILVSTLTMIAMGASSVEAQTSININELQAQVENVDVVLDTTKIVSAPTDDEIRKMSIFDACKALGVNPDYNTRYRTIIIPLCEAGVIMFPASSNPYGEMTYDSIDPVSGRPTYKQEDGRVIYVDCYYYVGTGPQNATLIRNMVANKHLIKNGKLVPGAAAKWRVSK